MSSKLKGLTLSRWRARAERAESGDGGVGLMNLFLKMILVKLDSRK